MCPTPLKKELVFVWEHHLSNEFFGQWLLKYVIPEEHCIVVQAVLGVMDNIWSYEELIYNFEYLGPNMLIELFPSHEQCLECLNGLVCLLLLPGTIKATKEAVAKPPWLRILLLCGLT